MIDRRNECIAKQRDAIAERGTELAAIVSIALSAVVVVALLLYAGIDSDAPIYAGSATSLVVFVLLSLWGPRDGEASAALQEG